MRTKQKNSPRIPMEVLERMAAALRVLAHPHRLRMVELLMEKELTVGQLAAELALAPSACSGHLNLMRAHGLLIGRRDGKTVFYRVTNPSAEHVIDCIRKNELD